jgi:hypothetical protein
MSQRSNMSLDTSANLSYYDAGDWSYYDSLNNLGDDDYHKIHIQQLSELYNITHDEYFDLYKTKFQIYEKFPWNFSHLLRSKIGKVIILYNFLSVLFIYILYLKYLKGPFKKTIWRK